ncbi:retrotransposon protein, putative, ty1-copia subclass [Tanacetum coccineum]
MLVSMTPKIQKNLEDRPAFEILQELKTMFQQQAEQELFETVIWSFHAASRRRAIVCTYDYDQFVQNYNMHDMGKTITELHAMLKLAEKGIPKKTPAVLALRQGQIQKPKSQARDKGKQRGKGKSKLAYDPKHKIPPPAKKENPTKDIESTVTRQDTRRRTVLYICNGHSAAVEAIGSFKLILPSGIILVLDNCHFSPSITRGIVSLSRLWDKDFVMNLWIMLAKENHKHNLDSTFLWHCRLGHINKKRIEKLQHDGLLESIDDESFDVCVSCISGKMARKPFTHASERADDLLGIIHSDVCGPFRTTSREVFEMFKTFQNEVENQLGKTIKALRSDRGGEYLSQEFLDHLRSRGIISQLTPPYTPQHNGVSERRNRTLLDMVRSMMSLTTLPMSFWGYALESAARILNMVPTKKVNKTPYEMWHGKVPNLSYLKVWGCEALVKRDTPNKLESRSIKCIFVGYPKETMGYYFYYPLENKNFVARYAEFFETRLIKQEASGSTVDFDEIKIEEAQPSKNTSLHQHEVEPDTVEPQTDEIHVCRSARITQAPERYGFYIDTEEHELGDHGEPPNYRAALSDLESEKCLEAINAEMQSMKDNQVWNLVDLPHNCKTVGSKWLFKKKTDMDSNIHTYKACLVAKRYYGYEIWIMDAKTTFLNGRLNEDVYMVQPEGFVNPKHPRRDCKLQISIYGLKQASRSWNKRFDEEIKRMDTSKHRTILMQPNVDLSNTQGPSTPAEVKRMKGIPYASAVGSIMYVVRCTRPNIAFSQNLTSRYQQNPGESHWSFLGWELSKLDRPMDMYCDNTGAITIADEPGVQRGAKHFRRKYHFIREAIQEGDIRILKVHTDDNLADPFTKPMPCTKHVEHARSIGLRPAGSFM